MQMQQKWSNILVKNINAWSMSENAENFIKHSLFWLPFWLFKESQSLVGKATSLSKKKFGQTNWIFSCNKINRNQPLEAKNRILLDSSKLREITHYCRNITYHSFI